MGVLDPVCRIFKEKAERVSAVVTLVKNDHEAIGYALDLCEKKETCQLLASGCQSPLSTRAVALCEEKQQKVIAAPCLAPDRFRKLEIGCQDRGIVLVGEDLRRHLAGIDIAFTVADYGIAETGTLVLDSTSEDLRLATMVSEVHVAVLPLSRLRRTAFELEPELTEMMQNPTRYIAFITGASRTADIERVLALGVHGPLELHVLLLEDR
ncbi:MAG: lactate utilization protein [Desulfobacterales bacterium]|nr:lactate utilization protein [Desulfobacterales bacterium]